MQCRIGWISLWVLVLTCFVGIHGCGSEDEDDFDSYYMTVAATHDTLTVGGLWQEMEDDGAHHGSYMLLQGYLHGVDDDNDVVTLIDYATSKIVDCLFDTDSNLADLQAILDNNAGSSLDIVTIGGVCYYDNGGTDDTSDDYPYLDDCDYYYVNDDQD